MSQYDSHYREQKGRLNELEVQYEEHQSTAVTAYIKEILKKVSCKLKNWAADFDMGYNELSKEVIINLRLPTISAVPPRHDYKYIKSRDEIISKKRKAYDVEEDYKKLICNIVLGYIYITLKSDASNAISCITINGHVKTIDKSTGHHINPCILSACTTKQEFQKINLLNVDSVSCIQRLKSVMSSAPYESLPVQPVRQVLQWDKRFVSGMDVLSSIDNRYNLMDLDPFQFENLVGNLFTKMGYETKQTQHSRDGGVDAIAYDTRLLVGGKIVIQAKRYKNTVGVAAVRELYGTLINEGAKKAILVSTSGYGPDAFEFIKNKPITLVDGNELLILLKEIGINAKIDIPKNN